MKRIVSVIAILALIVVVAIPVALVPIINNSHVALAATTGETPLMGGYNDTLNSGATEYNRLQGGYTWTATQTDAWQIMPIGGTLSELIVTASAAIVGNPYLMTVMLNGAPTALDCQLSVGYSDNADYTSVVNITAGDNVCLRSSIPGAAPGNQPYVSWSTVFTATASTQTIIVGSGLKTAGASNYSGLMSSGGGLIASDEMGSRNVIPAGGVISNLWAYCDVNDPDVLTYTLWLNGIVTAVAATVVNQTCTPELTDNISVVEGDYIQMRVTGAVGVANVSWGMVFTPTEAGEFIVLGASTDSPSTGEYKALSNKAVADVWSANWYTYAVQACNFTMKHIYTFNAVPGAGSERGFYYGYYDGATHTTALHVHQTTTTNCNATADIYLGSRVGAIQTRLFVYHGVGGGAPAASGGTQISFCGQMGLQVHTEDASDIYGDAATLNADIVDDAGAAVSVRFRYGTSATAMTNYTAWVGGYGTGDNATQLIALLTPSTTYYFQAQGSHADGTTVTGSIQSFTTTTGAPTVTTLDAYLIGVATAGLRGYLNYDTALGCQYRFEYGLTVAYGSATAWSTDNIFDGVTFTGSISGLTASTLYHYRAECRNSYGTGYGADMTFTTYANPNVITYLTAIPVSSSAISLSWVKGLGGPQTVIRWKAGGYPENFGQGTLVYQGYDSSYLFSGLTPGTTYFFSGWGFDEPNFYSATYDTAVATTPAGVDADTGATVDNGTAAPDSTNLDSSMLGGLLDFVSTYSELPSGTVGLMGYGAILLFFLVGVAAYNKSVLFTVILAIGGLAIGSSLGLVSVIFVVSMAIIGFALAMLRGGQPSSG